MQEQQVLRCQAASSIVTPADGAASALTQGDALPPRGMIHIP